MQQPTVSVAFQTDHPLSAYGPMAALVEHYGFDGVTVYNDMLYQPSWLPLLEIARATKRVRLGPAAVNPFTCHPINIAGNIALIDEAAHGRAYLGLARGAWLDLVGVEPRKPVAALAEAMRLVRHLLSGSSEPLTGEHYPYAGGDTLRWKVPRPDLPFLLGTWGPQTIRACAAEISEVKIGGTANPLIVPQIRAAVDDVVGAAGRARGTVGVVAGAVCVVDSDGDAARALARREAALYLPVIAALDRTLPLEPELLARINAAAAAYDFDAAGRNISDDLLRRLAFAGTPADVAQQALDLFAAGATRVEFGTPHGLSETTGLRLLGEAVLPAVREGLR